MRPNRVIRPTIMADVLNIDLRPTDEMGRAFLHRMVLLSERDRVMFTVLEGGEILAVGGISLMWPGVGLAIAGVATDTFPCSLGRTKWICKVVLQAIRAIMKEMKLHRVETSVMANYAGRTKFAAAMGFHSEGIMEKYGPDKSDWERFARVE